MLHYNVSKQSYEGVGIHAEITQVPGFYSHLSSEFYNLTEILPCLSKILSVKAFYSSFHFQCPVSYVQNYKHCYHFVFK